MSTWEDLKGSLFAVGRDVSQKAKEVSEVAKLKMDIRAKEDFVEKQFAILGRVYYETHKEDASEKDAEQFNVIKEAIDEIHRMNEQVMEIQGVVKCSNCGKKMSVGNSYCSGCGTKLEEVVAEAEVVFEEDVEAEVVVEEPIEEEIFAEDVIKE